MIFDCSSISKYYNIRLEVYLNIVYFKSTIPFQERYIDFSGEIPRSCCQNTLSKY